LSHIIEIKTEVRDAAAAGAACRRLGLEAPVHGSAELYSGTVTGLIVKLPGWRYPAVFNTESGQARYDIFNGRWGNQVQFDRFLQAYAVEKCRLEARVKGNTCIEQQLSDGSIKLTVQINGGAT